VDEEEEVEEVVMEGIVEIQVVRNLKLILNFHDCS
jgi:hypothetical protein